MVKLFFFNALLILCLTTKAQKNTTDSVKAAVNLMFKAMRTSDTILLQSTFTTDALLQTFSRTPLGKIVVVTETVPNFMKNVGAFKPGAIEERIVFETVKIDRNMAMAWTPYKLYIDGKFIQCGVNSFQLVRLDGLWKIQYIIDTKSKTGCN